MNDNYWTRRSLNRRRFLAAAATTSVGAAALAVAGCGDDDDDDSDSPTVAGQQANASPTTAVSAPKRGGTLQLRQLKNFNFDPIISATAAPSNFFASNVYGSLLRNKAGKKPDDTFAWGIEGDLAESVETVDELTYLFRLRQNVKTHNKPPTNGRVLTAEDIVLSMQKNMTDERNATRNSLGPIDGFPEAVDDKTIRIRTKTPYAPLLSILAYRNAFWIYPKEMLANDDIRKTTPVGTGPFMFKSKQDESFWEFESNPEFYRKDDNGEKLPYVAGVRYNIVPEEANAIAQFQAGNLDRLDAVTADNLEQVKRVKDVSLLESLEFLSSHDNVWPQQRRGPFRDEKLRQALSLAINRDAMLKVTGGGRGDWNNICNKVMGRWWLDPRGSKLGDSAKMFQQNQAEAKKLVEASGFSEEFNATYSSGFGESFASRQLFVIDQFRQIGLKPKPIVQDHASQWITPNGTFFGNYEGVALSAQTGYPHGYIILNNILHSKGAHNVGGVSDPQLDTMIEALGREFNDAKAVEQAHEIQRYAVARAYFIPTIINAVTIATQPRVKNIYVDHVYQFDSAERAWINPA